MSEKIMNKNEPFVSVIIPNYNHAKYLRERIDSILEQTYKNFEIIILDDKSTDNSLDVINQYKNNVHVTHIVINEENSGKVFLQWHKGFELASGGLIWIAESDDKCEPSLLEELVKEFQNDPNLALAFSRTMFFNDKGPINIAYGKIKNNKKECLSGKKFIQRYMAEGCYVANASSAVFRKDIALELDSIYSEFHGAGDRLFWIELAEKGNVAIINKPLNYCRRHNTNITEKNWVHGIIQREEKQILNYLINRNMITPCKVQFISANYIYYHILNQPLISEELRKCLLEVWEYNLLKKCIIMFIKGKIMVFKLKKLIC